MKIYIGIDDTDSRTKGMCTTYLGYKLISLFKNNGIKVDETLLVRLNPNIPFKTRGNGSVRITLDIEKSDLDNVIDITVKLFEKYSVKDDKNTNPGLVIIKKDNEKIFRNIYFMALRTYISNIEKIINFVSKKSIFLKYFGNGRGIIGASSACGALFPDYTYELLVYRINERKIDKSSLINMDKKYYPFVFDNYDYERDIALITPHGPDPVYLGIRGENPSILLKAFKELKLLSPYEGYYIFKTNQATDAHIITKKINEIRQYDNVRVIGTVIGNPKILPGSHVKISISDGTGKIDCMAYFETGRRFRKIVSKLYNGDLIEVYGGISKHKNTINIEKIKILKLNKIFIEKNPICPNCNKSMHSIGKNKGYKCKKCGFITNSKQIIEIKREINEGFYDVSPNARRHLSKPICRYGSEKIKM